MRMADRHLVDKCLNGDSAAFGMLVDRYKESVYALAYSRLRNFHDAEDITQEAFTKAYQKLRTLRRWDEFHAWIYAITSNLCKNWLKAKSRQPDREFIEDHPVRSLSYSMESRDEDPMLEVLHEALDSLPESYQQVLTLHYLGGMDGKEIAEFLGKSPSAIWQSLSRARASLKKEILDMMSETYEQNRLRSGFTFRIVEMVKRIRIEPVPPRVWPWGLSIAAGAIIGILCVGMNINLTNTESYTSISSLSEESKVLDIGEFPVDVMNVSDTSVISSNQLAGDSLGNMPPDMQNALFMAPQAEGGTWTKKADMPTARYNLATIAMDKKIYAIGGTTAKNGNTFYLPTLEEYNPLTDKWTKKKDMLTERANSSSSLVNGKIYAIGGWKDGINIELAAVEEYDPVSDEWTEKSDMILGRQWFSASSVDGKIYAIGGWRNGSAISSVEEYDPIKDNWVKKADIHIARYWFSTSVVGGKIYAIGGSDGTKLVSIVEEYDPKTDTWSEKANMPTSRANFSTGVINNKIYVIGGAVGDNFSSTSVEEYDPANDKWTRKANMPTERGWLPTCAPNVNSKIYVIGGVTNNSIIDTVEEYNPDTTGQNIDSKGKLPNKWGEVRTVLNK